MRMSAIRATALILALLPGIALALPRAWVSAEIGIDTGDCRRSAPCRTFAYALTQVDAGGEINALDSGGYGEMTITKAVSISVAPGIAAGIVAIGSAGVIVNAGLADSVVLRGLTITGNATSIGIDAMQFGRLHIERLILQGAGPGTASVGIQANASGHSGVLTITDTLARDHGSGVTMAGSLQATIERLFADGNGTGISVFGGGNTTLLDVVASGNDTGLFVWGLGVDQPSVVVERSALVGNAIEGLRARSDGADTTIALSANTISGNGNGVTMQESIPGKLVVQSRGNNTFARNGTDVAGGTLASLTPK